MAKGFSEQEKQRIKERLLAECAIGWANHGYKKTSVEELCIKTGISKGAFYLFFDSKESIFCETLALVQDNLYKLANEILERRPDKYGFAEVVKKIYREYCRYSFICDTTSADFLAFTNKLSKEQLNEIAQYSQNAGQVFLDKPYLKFAIEKDKAISAIAALLSVVSYKEKMCYNHFEVFDFMADSLIDKILL